jgi:hypothetical protein
LILLRSLLPPPLLKAFRVCQLEDRIFLFSVSCKAVGFEIYKLRIFSCDEFEVSFHLFNVGLAAARSF